MVLLYKHKYYCATLLLQSENRRRRCLSLVHPVSRPDHSVVPAVHQRPQPAGGDVAVDTPGDRPHIKGCQSELPRCWRALRIERMPASVLEPTQDEARLGSDAVPNRHLVGSDERLQHSEADGLARLARLLVAGDASMRPCGLIEVHVVVALREIDRLPRHLCLNGGRRVLRVAERAVPGGEPERGEEDHQREDPRVDVEPHGSHLLVSESFSQVMKT